MTINYQFSVDAAAMIRSSRCWAGHQRPSFVMCWPRVTLGRRRFGGLPGVQITQLGRSSG